MVWAVAACLLIGDIEGKTAAQPLLLLLFIRNNVAPEHTAGDMYLPNTVKSTLYTLLLCCHYARQPAPEAQWQSKLVG
jgi:hypothetical protein